MSAGQPLMPFRRLAKFADLLIILQQNASFMRLSVPGWIQIIVSCTVSLIKGAIAKLQRVQNSAIRLVAYVKRGQNIDVARRALHWLPIKDRIVFKLLLITYYTRTVMDLHLII